LRTPESSTVRKQRPRRSACQEAGGYLRPMRESELRRRAAWRFVRAVVRSQWDGVLGAVLSGLLWQAGAVAAPLIVKYAIDHGVVPRDRPVLVLWLLALLGVGLLEVAAGGMRSI